MQRSCVRLRPGDQTSDRPTIVHSCLSRPRRSVSPERPLSGVPITAPASGDRPGFLRRRHRSGKPFHSCGGNRWSLHDQKPFDIYGNAFMAERQDCESLFGLDRVDEQRPSLPDVGLDQFPDLLSHPRGEMPDVHPCGHLEHPSCEGPAQSCGCRRQDDDYHGGSPPSEASMAKA